jgi:hypothetical protein
MQIHGGLCHQRSIFCIFQNMLLSRVFYNYENINKMYFDVFDFITYAAI